MLNKSEDAPNASAIHIAVGHLITFDPTTNTGDFLIPVHPDNSESPSDSFVPLNTGFIPIGTMCTGPGWGMRFVPKADPSPGSPAGAQAAIFFADRTQEHPICACFLYNNVETPPWTDATTQGWKDAAGSAIATTQQYATQAYIASPAVGLGDLFSNLGSDNDVVTVSMLRTAVTSVFNSHVHTGVKAGPDTSAAPTTTMTPQGSATVRAKN